jgi:hypothetical protein
LADTHSALYLETPRLVTSVMFPRPLPGRIGLAAESRGNGRTPFTNWLRFLDSRRSLPFEPK